MTEPTNQGDLASAERLLAKLRGFVASLDTDERAALAALLGPGIAMAYRDEDVEGFGVTWAPQQLPDHLAQIVRTSGVEIIGLDVP